MNKTPLSTLLASLVLTSCTTDHLARTRRVGQGNSIQVAEEKWLAYADSRTVQLHGASDFVVTDGWAIRGAVTPVGQAACVSSDGYMLTARHCLDKGPLHVPLPPPQLGPEYWVGELLPGERARLRHRNGSTRIVPQHHLHYSRVRVVHAFRGIDLALVHADRLLPAEFFPLAHRAPAPHSQVFSRSNPLNGRSRVTLGTARAREPFRLNLTVGDWRFGERPSPSSWRLCCSTLTQMGDSGGPLFSAEGELIGVVSHGSFDHPLFGRSRPLCSYGDGLPGDLIQQAISLDRKAAERSRTPL